MEELLRKTFQLCPCCQNKYQELYSVSNCSHRFCYHCSVQYIEAQVNNFSAAKCLQDGCGSPLDKSQTIYRMLDQSILVKLQQFQRFTFLQENPEYISCKSLNCQGIFLMKQRICTICQSVHCKKCGNLQHNGKCVQSQQEKQMFNLNFRKCPKCRIWVQKSQGCRFIKCKCKTQFCFTCGSQFSQDPCRKREMWEKEIEIKELLSKIKIEHPGNAKYAGLLLVRVILALIVLMPLIVLFNLVVVLTMAIGIVFSLFIPLGLCYPISSQTSSCCKILSYTMLIIFYPLLIAIISTSWIIIIVLYPFCRNWNHHGLYDPFDKGMNYLAFYYLRLSVCVLTCFES